VKPAANYCASWLIPNSKELAEIETLFMRYLQYAEVIIMPDTLPRLPQCRDTGDQKFLNLSAAGQAEVLVTGDLDLLDLTGQTIFVIETAAAFRMRVEGELS